MSRRTAFRKEAEEEIAEAVAWYEGRKRGLSGEFLRSLDAAIAKVERNPLHYPVVHGRLRRALLRRFPYALIYFVSEHEVVVIGCMHARQEPRRWHQRK